MMNHTVDLIPEDTRRRRAVFRRILYWLAITAIVSAGSLGVGVSKWVRAGEFEAQLQPLRERVAAMEGWDQKIAPLAEQLKTAQERHRIVGRLIEEPFWSGLLSDVADASGEGVLLGQVSISREITAEKDKPSQEVTRLAMSGVAPSNADLLNLLSKLEASKSVKSVSLERSAVNAEQPNAGEAETTGMVNFDVRGIVQ